jgi:transcriptional regulator with GAF, ATPase, and Fis domain
VDRYFKAAYTFALSGTATRSTQALVTQIEETLQTSLGRAAVIILKDLNASMIRSVRIKISDEILQRVRAAATMAKNRIYFGAPDISRPKETVAWIPLQSETRDGGIYVVCRQNEPALTEKEMELLAIIGTIGNGALRTLEANQTKDLENTQLAEFHGMIGASKAIREVYSHVEIAAKNTATVLIEGESGTGKELVAKAIHAAGARAKEPFIAVDCGAIPEALIEAELFGAKKGSYTGALTDRAGLFEAANRGTIFLDEISNTTPALQARLLRVIQEREVRRIGETKDRPIDVRLIVASNRNLEELVTEGRFRKDLLYRLKVLYIKVPPLRNRREDIPMIAHAYLQKLNATNKLKKYCAPGVIDHLAAQNFPGNVRELQNAIERAYFFSKGNLIHDIPVQDQPMTAAHRDEVQAWFKDLSEGRQDFWLTVHDRYKRRDITREKVVALVDLGLRSSGGSYKALASKFHLKRNEYRRFMDFLRRNKCLLDFRPYRQAAANDTIS